MIVQHHVASVNGREMCSVPRVVEDKSSPSFAEIPNYQLILENVMENNVVSIY